MASVSSKYTTGAIGMGSSNTQAQPPLWSYAVQSDEAIPDPSSPPNGDDADDYNTKNYATNPPFRQPLSNQVNGTSRLKTRRKNKPIPGLDTEYSASGSLKPPAPIHDHGDISGTNSEADSLLDLYGSSRDQLKTASRSEQDVKKKESFGAVSAGDDQNHHDIDSKWIHRDKLAQIESRELRDMGGIPAHSLSARSRSRGGKKSSKAPSLDVDTEAASDAKRQRTVSPTFSYDEQEQQEFGQDQPASPDRAIPKSQTTAHGRRPSTSKIPVTKSSGLAESSSPTQPGSSNQRGIRARSASQTSQNILDAANSTSPTSPAGALRGVASPAATSSLNSQSQSPPKSKIPSKATPPSAARGGLRGGRSASGQSRPRTASGPGTGSSSRPGTSGGPRSPEGDPPWIATMYKPDPRLPPDQQMLPTHAKRLAQEQGAENTMMYETSQPESTDFMLLDSEEQADDSPTEYEGQDTSLEQEETDPAQTQREVMPLKTLAAESSRSNRQVNRSDNSQSHHQTSIKQSEEARSPYSTENHESNEWPLRSPSDKTSFQTRPSPKSDSASFAQSNARSGTPHIDSGYSLIPTIHSPKEMEQRLSQRSGLSNSTPLATTNTPLQPIRVPEEPVPNENEKKKGCAACCIVM